MLDRFRTAQAPAVERLVALGAAGKLPAPFPGIRPGFAQNLRRNGPGAVIAEYKRASPSQGEINLVHSPEDIAQIYTVHGASAISVLTEQEFFKGDIAYLARMSAPGLPLLRKDFLVHPLQVVETASTPASALLLITRMLSDTDLVAMLAAAQRAGLEAVLEIFDAEDLARTRLALDKTGAEPAIIQVNTRDLQTLKVAEAPMRELIRDKRTDELWIAASGICSRAQVVERAEQGFDAVLVGTSLMSGSDPGAALAVLTGHTQTSLP